MAAPQNPGTARPDHIDPQRVGVRRGSRGGAIVKIVGIAALIAGVLILWSIFGPRSCRTAVVEADKKVSATAEVGKVVESKTVVSDTNRRQCGASAFIADCAKPTEAELKACFADSSGNDLVCPDDLPFTSPESALDLANKGSLDLCRCGFVAAN